MKGHKLLALLLALLLCVQLLPVSTAFAAEVSEDGVSVTLKANDVEYGTVTSGSKLTGLGNGDTVELTATPKAGSNVKFSKWVVFKGDEGTAPATEGTDYRLTEAVSGSGKATLTVLDTTENLRVLAVFQGKIVGLKNQYQEFAPIPAQSGQNWIIQVNGGSSAAGTTKITGWNNDPKETLLVTTTFTTAPGETDLKTLTLQVWKKLNGMPLPAFPNVLASGASYKFDNLTSVADTAGYTGYRFPGEGWDWTEYDFSIVGSDGKVLKPGKLVFRYPGIAVIEAENGKVKCGNVTYENGATAKLGTGNQTIEAVADEGYVFTGWEISGVELSDATANPLTFTMPTEASTIIKAKFAKTVSVTLKANDVEYGTVTSGSKLTGLGNGDTVELTATPKAGSNVKFSKWVVFKGDEGTAPATEGTDYRLTEAVSGSGKATLTVLDTTENLRVLAVFQGKIVGLKNQYQEFAPIPAQSGQNWIIQVNGGSSAAGTTKITGWNNDPKETLLVTTTFTTAPGETDLKTLTLQVWKKLNGMPLPAFPNVLASGASYKFDNLTSVADTAGYTGYRFPGEGWDWTEYDFSIVGSDGKVLKPGKLVFRYPGIAVIEAENGKVKCGNVTYENGATAKLGTGNQTIEAVADEGYVFTGWEISGVELSDATTNPLTFTMPTEASTIIKAKFAKKAGTPELGYQLSIEGSGKVFVDGVELANGYIAEVADKTSVKFLAEPDEGYVLDHWELSSPNGGSYSNSSGNLKTVFITKNYGDKFYNVKAVFVQKDTYKLRFKLMLEKTDVTQGDDFERVCKNKDCGIPYLAYTFPSTMSLDEIYSSLSSSIPMSSFDFDSGLNYMDFSVGSNDWIVIGLNQYPGYTAQGGPQFIADGFESSNKSAVADMRSIPHLRFDGRTYIVFKMTKDTTITANIHEMVYTAVTVPTDETKGTVTITPTADAEALGMWWEGSKLTVQAVPAEGYRFVRWQESAGGYINDENAAQNPLNFTLGTASAKFSPVFELAEAVDRSITKVVDPKGKATITINGSPDTLQVREGSVVSLGIDVDEYYLFDHWIVTQNGVESSYNLVAPENQKSENATFVMPFGESGVTVKAVLKDRYSELETLVFLMTGNNGTTAGTNGLAAVSLSKNDTPLTDVNCQVQKGDELEIAVTMLNEDYVLREITVVNMDSFETLQTITDAQGTITIPSWNSWRIAVRIEKKTEDTARHSISLTQPTTGGTISSSNTTSQPDKTITLTAVPDSGYVLKKWIVKDAQENGISVTTDNNVDTFTMPKSDVTVTAEFESTSEITPTITSVALLQGKAGNELATGVLSGDKWTITIPDTVSAETVELIPEGTSGLFLKIVTPTGVTVKQMDGGGSWAGDWSKGDIVCWMPVGEEVTFKATAGTATKDYTIKLIYSGSGEPTEPILSNGSATRISNSGAAVQFSSNVAGNYFYKVVNHSAAAPTVEEILASSNKGTASTGVNNITLSNLGDGARDIYIVVVDASNNRSVVLKIEIPAYGSIDVPDTGAYTITVKAPKGGTIIPNRTKANAGDEIIVTVTPDSGYQMVADSLTYTLAVAGGETVKITNNRFTMPEGNVSISCQWETAATTSTGITGFSINGVAGAVNNSTNTITITMPRGTDVTKLTPVIATNGVKSLTPGNGETVDFTNAVTYTAAMEDGSSKTYTVTVYVDKGTLADQFWDKLTDFATQVPWWQYAEKQQSTSKYPKYW